MKRKLLFLAANIALILVLTIALNLPGIDERFAAHAHNVGAPLAVAAVFGFCGALISLALSN